MRSRGFGFALLLLALACFTRTLHYPETPRGDQVDVLHGVRVADPYRWLEAIDSEEVRAWIGAQNELTFGYLGRIALRERIRQRLAALLDYDKYGLPVRRGGRYFFTRTHGLANQPVLYWSESLGSEPRVLLDVNALSDDGTVALRHWSVSEDGRLLVYGTSVSGSDWQEWRVRQVDSGVDLEDRLSWVKFSGAAWTHDGGGFFYGRYDAPEAGTEYRELNYYQKLYYHRIGTAQADDTLIYERPDQKEWGFGKIVTEDGRYLVISVRVGSQRRNAVFYKDIASEDGEVIELLTQFDARYGFLGNDGPVFYFKTDFDAPRSRIIAIDIRSPDLRNWREIVPESQDTLRSASFVHDRIVAVYLRDASSRVRVFDRSGRQAGEIELPGIGTVSGFRGRRRDPETFYVFSGFTAPPTIYRYAIETGKSSIVYRAELDFDPDAYVTRQVFYQSKDGTRVPMFVTHQKGLERDGSNPTYLYGYGGFRASLTPRFSVSNLVWMELGGVYAQANLRGGGEYGRAWHMAGTKLEKQNVFDDFIAAAEWLIQNGYTKPRRLAIGGGSNGGLLVGAAMTQRPDLFAACVPAVGVLDMLRFHKFTIGWAWASDYGSPENPEEFASLLAYSPYHNVRSGTAYPATLIMTGDHDDRVFPAHSFKFAAALQSAQAGPAPVLLRVETEAGHGGGTPTTKRLDQAADRLAFLVDALDVHPLGPRAPSW